MKSIIRILFALCIIVADNAYCQNAGKSIYDQSAYIAHQQDVVKPANGEPVPRTIPESTIAIVKFRLTDPSTIDRITVDVGSDKGGSQCSSLKLQLKKSENSYIYTDGVTNTELKYNKCFLQFTFPKEKSELAKIATVKLYNTKGEVEEYYLNIL